MLLPLQYHCNSLSRVGGRARLSDLSPALIGPSGVPKPGRLARNVPGASRPRFGFLRPTLAAQRSNGVEIGTKKQKLVTEDVTPSDGEIVPLAASQPTGPSSRFQNVGACVVAGAAGKTGRAIVQRLIQEGLPVRALVRDVSAAAQLLPGSENNVELYQGDVFKFQTLPAAIEGSKVLFIATGTRPALDPFGPYNVEYQGTLNLLAAAQQAGVEKIVLISSIGVDDVFFPLNLLFGVLFWKKRAEEAIQRSGMDYTIVRPGGLRDEPSRGSAGLVERIVIGGANAFGLPPRKRSGSIQRRQVAELAVEAVVEPAASRKVVEVFAETSAPLQSFATLFASVP